MYNDKAVILPARGAVLVAPDQTEAPTVEQIQAWTETNRTGNIGEYEPLGYTSLDDLPVFSSDTEGGEVKGVWENPSLRTTAVTTTDSIEVNPVQLTEVPLQHRFGNAKVDKEKGIFVVPSTYVATNVSLLIVFLDGSGSFVAAHAGRAVTSPNGNLEADPENFLSLPIKYTILNPPKEGVDRLTWISPAMKGESVGAEESEGVGAA